MNAPVNTRTFKSGNSEVVRLPKGLGFGIGTEVNIERSGDTLTIRAVIDPEHERRELDRMLDDMLAIGTPSDGVQPRVPFEWIDRPGL
jgi:antitoxin VapB